MYWKRDEATQADFLQVSWLNLIKICRLKEKDGRFLMEVVRK